jgi:hypothetical protein
LGSKASCGERDNGDGESIHRRRRKTVWAVTNDTRRTLTNDARRTAVVPLPHPSGASSWIHEARHKELLERGLDLIAQHWRALQGKRRVA